MCTEPTDNSDSGAVTLASHGQEPPLSSPNSETRKDSTSTRQQATRVLFQANLVNAVKRPANMTRKKPIIALHWVVRISSADHLPLPVSLEPEDDLAHTHQCCDYSISQDAEQSGESQHVLTKLHVCGMEGKRRKIASSVDPELHYGQISMTQKDGTPRVPRRNAYNGTWYIAWLLSMVGQSSRVVILVVLGLVRSLWWDMGTKLG